MEMSRNRRWRVLAAVAGVVGLLPLTACSSSGNSKAGPSGGGSTDAAYQRRLDALYKGTFTLPSGPAIKAPTGKTIWVVTVGNGIDASTRWLAAVEQAAAALHWTVKSVDGKFDPNQQLSGIEQAVAAKADGIVLAAIDCSSVKNGVVQAKNAGIPVVSFEGQDCSPSLLHVVSYAGRQGFSDWIKGYGAAQAAWVIAKTNGGAKVVLNTETDGAATRLEAAGSKAELAKCSTCKVVADASFTGADFGPKLQQKIQQAFVAHPDANAFIPSYDAVMTQYGGVQALRGTGRISQLKIAGGEGSAAGISQIRSSSGMQMCVGEDLAEESWAAVDALARLFLHRDPNELDTGIGIQVCDKDHNLPPAGQPFQSPVDFRSAYAKLWSGA